MPQLFETLENRALMSVTATTLSADVKTVSSQTATLRADLAALKSQDTSFRNSLVHDIKLLETKTDRISDNRLISTLRRDSSIDFLKVTLAETSFVLSARSDAAVAAADGKRLLLHPAKAAYQNKVNHDITLLSTLSTKLTNLQNAVLNASTLISPVYTQIESANPSLVTTITTALAGETSPTTAFADAAVQVVTDTNQLATDLTFPVVTDVTLTGATFFRGNSTGANQGTSGSVVNYGAWTTGLDVQNVPGNYAAEFFIAKVPNPAASQFLTPGNFASALTTGANTFYFFADGDDLNGGSQTFGINLFLNGAGVTSPALSGYTVPGTGQSLSADSSSTTVGINLTVTPGAGALSVLEGATETVSLSNFVVQGVSGQNSTVDLVNSTNTAPFSPPAHPDGVMDTYGTFTITVTP
jgi:hypothetical protein